LGGVGSLAWAVVVAAIFVPDLSEVLFPFLPDDDNLVRGTAIALAVALPPVNGVVMSRMQNRDPRPAAVLREIPLSYGYATVIAFLVVALVVVVPTLKISYIFRMFELEHIAVMVKQGTYDDVLAQVERALDRHGVETQRQRPQRVIWWLFRALTWVEERVFRRSMAKDMAVLVGHTPDGDWFEVTLHATDISIIGRKDPTTLVMAILSEELDETHLYFSWDDASQALEDRIQAAQERLARGEAIEPGTVAQMCEDLRSLGLSTEEWNAIRRQIYGLERDYYRHHCREGTPELAT
jgi:hypothetical protein